VPKTKICDDILKTDTHISMENLENLLSVIKSLKVQQNTFQECSNAKEQRTEVFPVVSKNSDCQLSGFPSLQRSVGGGSIPTGTPDTMALMMALILSRMSLLLPRM
jgi:hypothetical protein